MKFGKILAIAAAPFIVSGCDDALEMKQQNASIVEITDHKSDFFHQIDSDINNECSDKTRRSQKHLCEFFALVNAQSKINQTILSMMSDGTTSNNTRLLDIQAEINDAINSKKNSALGKSIQGADLSN